MCILFCYLHDEKVQLGYDLILLSNRDEEFQRAAVPAHVWKETCFALGGQDQTQSREGGTWLCLNTVQSKIGVLLNLPSRLLEEQKLNAQSRGFIVPNYVNNSESDSDFYMDELQKTKTNYTGFNFLALERQSKSKKWRAKYINNSSPSSLPIEITTPLFGFSNHIYGEQYAFRKTQRGCQLLETILAELTDNHTKPITDEQEMIRRAFGLLSDCTTFLDDSNMAATYSHYTPEIRHQISSINVHTTADKPNYGTRTSTVILVRHDQSGVFIEKTLANPLVNPSQWTEQIWQFQLNNPNEPPRRLNE